MAVRVREFVWKTPYKPTQNTENEVAEAPATARHSSSLSPKAQPAPTTDPDDQVSFDFPQRTYSIGAEASASALFLSSQSSVLPDMADPTTLNEVGSPKFPSNKTCHPTQTSYHFFPIPPTIENLAEKEKMIASLRNHSVNTLAELRRIERIFASMGTSDLTEPMTTAWQYYVNSHMLLTELRSLTRNYPFSSECLDEAKRRVLIDPDSNRSWNYCWLVLSKISSDNLIPYYASHQASLPAMWGNQTPTAEGVSALSTAFLHEWNYALNQMLRNWESPPVGRET